MTQTLETQLQLNTQSIDRAIKALERLEKSFNKTMNRAAQTTTRAERATQQYGRATEQAQKTAKKGTQTTEKQTQATQATSKATTNAAGATQAFDIGLQDLTKSTQLALGPLSGVASRITATTAILKANVASIATTVIAITGLTVATRSIITQTRLFQEQMLQTEGTVELLGDTAQFTAEEVKQLGFALGESTLTSFEEATAAATDLLRIQGLTREQLEETLFAAQGLTTVVGGTLSRNAQRLGRLLEAPLENLSALRRVGLQFTKEEEERLQFLQESLQTNEANELILEKVAVLTERGRDAAGGFSGALDTAGERIRRIAIAIGESANTNERLSEATNAVANKLLDILNNTRAIEQAGNALAITIESISRGVQFLVRNFEKLVAIITGVLTFTILGAGLRLVIGLGRAVGGLAKGFQTLAKRAKDASVETKGAFDQIARGISAIGGIGGSILGAGAFSGVLDAFNISQIEKDANRAVASIDKIREALSQVREESTRVRLSQKLTEIEGNISAASDSALKAQSILNELEKRYNTLSRSVAEYEKVQEEQGELNAFLQDSYDQQVEELAKVEEKIRLFSQVLKVNNDIVQQGTEKQEELKKSIEGLLNSYVQLGRVDAAADLIRNIEKEIRPAAAANRDYELTLRSLTTQIERVSDPSVFDTKAIDKYKEALNFKGTRDELVEFLRGIRNEFKEVGRPVDEAAEKLTEFAQKTADEFAKADAKIRDSVFGTGLASETLQARISLRDVDDRQLTSFVRQVNQNLQQAGLGQFTISATDRSGIAEQLAEASVQQDRLNEGAKLFRNLVDAPLPARSPLEQAQQSGEAFQEQLDILRQFRSSLEENSEAAKRFDQNFPDIRKKLAFEEGGDIGKNFQETVDNILNNDALTFTQQENQVQTFFNDYLENLEEFFGIESDLYQDQAELILALRNKAFKDINKDQDKAFDEQLQIVSDGLSNLNDAFAAAGQEQSQIAKRIAQTQILVSGAVAIAKALEQGPFLGPALAGTIAASIGAQIAAVQSAASGGLIRGPGTTTSDSIPARLSDKEFVMQASAVEKFGTPFMNMINRGEVPSFADGGSVMPVPISSGSESMVNIEIIDQRSSGEQISAQESYGPDGGRNIRIVVRDAVKDMFNRGELDRTMRSNFRGIDRKPANR